MDVVFFEGARTLLTVAVCVPMVVGCGDDFVDDPTGTGGSAGGGGLGVGGAGGEAGPTGGTGGTSPGGAGGGGGSGGTSATCDGLLVEAFGDFSGALAVDGDGNVFAGATMADGSQTARAFAAADIAANGAATGTEVLALDGFGGPMAALSPDASGHGLLLYQPTDGSTYMPLDPLGVHYDASGADIVAVDAASPIVTLTVPGTAVSLMADDAQRLWIGMPRIGGGTTFVVLERDDGGACLTPGGVADYFSISASDLCFADWYDAPELELTALAFTRVEPTWGNHGGPLAWRPGSAAGTIDLLRLDVPAVGDMTVTATTFDPSLPGSAEVDYFIGARVVDVPSSTSTLFSYSELDTTGEVLRVEGGNVTLRQDAVGVFTLDTFGGSEPRLLYTGLSVVGSDAPSDNGLYSAPVCNP